MAKGLLTKGAKLSYKLEDTFVELEDLQSIPDLGGDTDSVETTTLKHGARTYIPGLKDYGDLEFEFLYTSEGSFQVLQGLEAAGKEVDFQVELPDGTTISFPARASVKLNAIAVGEALTFIANLAVADEMVFA